MKLVMLTSNYPYGQFGDNCFIQNEIRALAERFDDITVISTGTGAMRDDVPDNVKVIGVFSRKIRWTKLCVAALSLSGKRVRDAMRELKLLYGGDAEIRGEVSIGHRPKLIAWRD